MLFNLFTKALYQLLERALAGYEIDYYLDDFIFMFSKDKALLAIAVLKAQSELTDILGIPYNKKKDRKGTTVEVLSIEINTVVIVARLLPTKVEKLSR